MPSWLDNIWALSPWAAEPERDAAQAPSLRNFLPPVQPLVVPPPTALPTGPRTELPDITYDTEDWFQSLERDWPSKAVVIPPDRHVSKEMNDNVRTFVNRHIAKGATAREKLHCFDFANYQLHRAREGECYRTGGPPWRDSHSYQILINYWENGELFEEVQLAAAIEAVMYIKEVLHQDTPVLVGICLRKYHNRDGTIARPNDVKSTWFVEPTNHYVVIVGMDRDNDGHPYFQYYDYRYRPDSGDGQGCKLFLLPTMKLEVPGSDIVLAEVRRTLPG